MPECLYVKVSVMSFFLVQPVNYGLIVLNYLVAMSWCISVFGYFSKLLHAGKSGKQSDGLTLIIPHIWITKGQAYSLIKCTVFLSRYTLLSGSVSRSHPHKFRRILEPGTSCWHVQRPLNQHCFNIYYNYSMFLLHQVSCGCDRLLTGELRCGCWRDSLKIEAEKVGQRFTDVEAMGKPAVPSSPLPIPCHCLPSVHSLHEELDVCVFPITTNLMKDLIV